MFNEYKKIDKITLSLDKKKLSILFSEENVLKSIIKFINAIKKIKTYYEFIKNTIKNDFDLEISIDESEYPTSYTDHYILVSELNKHNIKIFSLAPKFRGKFEKGIDYIGNIKEFKTDLEYHSALVKKLGNYKISIHTGSDKFSLYPLIAKTLKNKYHIKTAGTSFLEALKTVGMIDIELFKNIYTFSKKVFSKERKSYHLSTNIKNLPKKNEIKNNNIQELFEYNNDFRQVLHVAFGAILTYKSNKENYFFKEKILKILLDNYELYNKNIIKHFSKHLKKLKI